MPVARELGRHYERRGYHTHLLSHNAEILQLHGEGLDDELPLATNSMVRDILLSRGSNTIWEQHFPGWKRAYKPVVQNRTYPVGLRSSVLFQYAAGIIENGYARIVVLDAGHDIPLALHCRLLARLTLANRVPCLLQVGH